MTSAQDRAYSLIKEWIIGLEVKPGQQLRAHSIAKKLKTSRTPVREALSRLQQEGLVAANDGWGYVVQAFTFKDTLDLFNVRESLEVQAALEALPNLKDEVLAQLDASLRESSGYLKAGHLAKFRAANRQFHMLIAAASRNNLLQKLLAMINDRILFLGALHQDMRKERAQEVQGENTAILAALRDKDVDMTRVAVLAHIRNSKIGLLQLSGVGIVESLNGPALSSGGRRKRREDPKDSTAKAAV